MILLFGTQSICYLSVKLCVLCHSLPLLKRYIFLSFDALYFLTFYHSSLNRRRLFLSNIFFMQSPFVGDFAVYYPASNKSCDLAIFCLLKNMNRRSDQINVNHLQVGDYVTVQVRGLPVWPAIVSILIHILTNKRKQYVEYIHFAGLISRFSKLIARNSLFTSMAPERRKYFQSLNHFCRAIERRWKNASVFFSYFKLANYLLEFFFFYLHMIPITFFSHMIPIPVLPIYNLRRATREIFSAVVDKIKDAAISVDEAWGTTDQDNRGQYRA